MFGCPFVSIRLNLLFFLVTYTGDSTLFESFHFDYLKSQNLRSGELINNRERTSSTFGSAIRTDFSLWLTGFNGSIAWMTRMITCNSVTIAKWPFKIISAIRLYYGHCASEPVFTK